jgi:outer membrane receptor protein involved in Fe transport
MIHSMLPRTKKLPALVLAASATLAVSAQAQMLEEVVVTAQKRVESLQDVPISVSAMSQQKMEEFGIDRIENLAEYVPNLSMSETGIGTNIYIRGVGSGINPGFEQSTGMYMDGIYYGRAQLARAPFLDLERVEVLRGPQPILFGKNSIAGAISMITAKPTDEFEGTISALYEPDHGELEGTLVLSGPLTDTLSGRLAVRYREMDGFMDNKFLNDDEAEREETTFRGILQWDATDRLTMTLKGEIGEFDVNGRNIEIVDDYPSENPAFGGLTYSQIQVGVFGSDPTALETKQNFNRTSNGDFSENDTENLTFQFDYDIGEHTLTGVTGWVSYEFDELCDCDFSSAVVIDAPLEEEYEQFSQELRLTSPGGETIDYIVGAFYQTSELDSGDVTNVPVGSILEPAVNGRLPGAGTAIAGTGGTRTFTQDTDLWAVFGQMTWNISDSWRLTVGARYTEEEKDGARKLVLTNSDGTPVADPGQEGLALFVYGQLFNIEMFDHDLKGSRDEESFTPLVTVQWDVNDDIMTYFTASTGFKSGGYDSRGNVVPGTTDPRVADPTKGSFEYEEEEATSFEIGAKTRLFDNSVELNMAAFYTTYDDLQVSIFDGTLGFVVDNAAEADIMGFEMDGRWAATERLTIYGSLAWIDFEFQDFENGQCNWTERNQPSCIENGTISYEGRTNQYVADWSGTLSADYWFEIGDSMELRTTLDLVYSDEYFPSQNLDPTIVQDSYTKVNARIALSSNDGSWEIAVLGRNLTDEEVITYANPIPLAQSTFSSLSHYAFLERPRNIAVQAVYRF